MHMFVDFKHLYLDTVAALEALLEATVTPISRLILFLLTKSHTSSKLKVTPCDTDRCCDFLFL